MRTVSNSKYTSYAVSAQRFDPFSSADDFPTPPWATRALIKHVLQPYYTTFGSCLEPACGAGAMSEVLKEYFSSVDAQDIHDYGYGKYADFLASNPKQYDWVITNPPFKLGEEFVTHALGVAKTGVAVLVRTVFIESVGRHERLFSRRPPSLFAQFTERVPMVKGRLDPKITTATGYAWLVWISTCAHEPRLTWIPKCRRQLEKAGDYSLPTSRAGFTR